MEKGENTNPELMTITEVAERFGVDPTTVRRWVKEGALKAFTLPATGTRQVYRVHSSDVQEILNTPYVSRAQEQVNA